jgi:hypothetical protein
LLAGVTADAFGVPAAMWLITALTFGSGCVAALRMAETLPTIAHAVPNRGDAARASPSGRSRLAVDSRRPE